MVLKRLLLGAMVTSFTHAALAEMGDALLIRCESQGYEARYCLISANVGPADLEVEIVNDYSKKKVCSKDLIDLIPTERAERFYMKSPNGYRPLEVVSAQTAEESLGLKPGSLTGTAYLRVDHGCRGDFSIKQKMK